MDTASHVKVKQGEVKQGEVKQGRRARLTVQPAPDARNSLVLWHRTVAPWRVLRAPLRDGE